MEFIIIQILVNFSQFLNMWVIECLQLGIFSIRFGGTYIKFCEVGELVEPWEWQGNGWFVVGCKCW